MSINIRYIYSACVVISTEDVKILCDPWFTEGIYDGSWYHFPKVDDPINLIGDVDYIYISHIHPDHYDPKFIKKYFNKFGVKNIIISDHNTNYLASKMMVDKINYKIINKNDNFKIGQSTLYVLPHETGSIADIDSALIVEYDDSNKIHRIVNVNDIIFDDKMIEILKSKCNDVDILLCGYTGAGPYPQTYFDLNDNNLIEESKKKKSNFFKRYKKLVSRINSKVNIPFAGKYILGGCLSHLNDFRGVADAVEVLNFDKQAIVLADSGGEINTINLIPTKKRIEKYPKSKFESRVKEISSNLMDYERLINKNEIKQLPLIRLLRTAYNKAIIKSECDTDYFFIFEINHNQFVSINANHKISNGFLILNENKELPEPRSEIKIDNRYLFGLLTNVYHWNNAEIGSQYYIRRYPNEFNRSGQRFLNFLTV